MDPYDSCSLALILLNSSGSWQIILLIVILLVLLVASALASGSEVAFFSISLQQREDLKVEKDSNSLNVIRLLEHPDQETGPKRLLATILVLNNFINVGIVILSAQVLPLILPQFDQSKEILGLIISANALQTTIEVGLVTFFLVLFGEVIPKVYATNYNLNLAKTMSSPLLLADKIFSPITKPLTGLTNLIDKRLGKRMKQLSEDDLGHALELTNNEDRSDEEQKMLEGIVSFGNIDVKQILTPRTDLQALKLDSRTKEVVAFAEESGHSRIPVFQESLDEIVGIVFTKDLLNILVDPEMDWKTVIRTPYFVPENKKIEDLLREFQSRKIHMAIIVDEYGGTTGLVTLEDILEEIIGEITDEFDDEDIKYSRLDDNNYVFEGKTALIDIYRILELDGSNFEAQKGDADTLAGFVVEQAGKIPLKGERINFDSYTLTVEASDKRRVKRVKITLNEKEENENI